MNATVEDLRPTIIPKSDQLNAEQLLGGPMTVTVTEVRLGSGEEQPVVVHYAGEDGRPYKPCKTCRKILIHAWGADGHQWAGRSLTLYNDPDVKFGGEDVGGIRISHMTDLERDVKVSLTSTRGKKAKYEIKRLSSPVAGQLADIAGSPTVEALKDNFGAAYKATKDVAVRAQLKAAYDARLKALNDPPAAERARGVSAYDAAVIAVESAGDAEVAGLVLDKAAAVQTYAVHADRVIKAANAEAAALALDAARGLPDDQYAELTTLYANTWSAQ